MNDMIHLNLEPGISLLYYKFYSGFIIWRLSICAVGEVGVVPQNAWATSSSTFDWVEQTYRAHCGSPSQPPSVFNPRPK